MVLHLGPLGWTARKRAFGCVDYLLIVWDYFLSVWSNLRRVFSSPSGTDTRESRDFGGLDDDLLEE